MYVRDYDFISVHNILFKNKDGFREKHCMCGFVGCFHQVGNELDRKHYSVGIFIYFSKAFDALDHKKSYL